MAGKKKPSPPAHTRYPPGVSGNPSGKRKLPPELLAFKELTADEVKRIFAKYARMAKMEVEEFLAAVEGAMIDRVIASSLLKAEKDGDLAKLEYLLNRTIGKVADKTEVKLPTPFTITRKNGDQVVLGAKKEEEE